MSEDKNTFHVEQDTSVSRETSPFECPLCSSARHKPYLNVIDHFLSQEQFEIRQCDGCGLRFTWPVPDNLGPYYDSKEYLSHAAGNPGITARIYRLVQKFNLRYKFKSVRPFVTGNNWVDYGAGAGAFMTYCQSKGQNISGVEIHGPSRTACQNDELAVLSPEEYLHNPPHADCITLWHVLEHVNNLPQLLRTFHLSLNEHGVLAIAVPNPDSLDARMYRQHWAAYDVPRHLWHFDEGDITRLAEEYNFHLVETLSLPFDAFYISLLSEKYKNGYMVRGLIRGFLSNIRAWLKQTPYSSQIYILRK